MGGRLCYIDVFPALNINIDDYFAVKNYLESFQPKLYQTGETFINKAGEPEKTRKKTGNKWFETQDQIGFVEEFSKESNMEKNWFYNAAFIPMKKCIA